MTMKEKYADLLLKRCLQVAKANALFISYNKLVKEFVDIVVKKAKEIGITDIYLEENDFYYIHDFLMNASKEEIKKSDLFNSAIWDEYVKKNGAFLMLESEIPKLMDDIPSEKIALSSLLKRTTKPLYKKYQLENKIPWCIAAVPNLFWAKELFGDKPSSLDDFWQVMAKICKLDQNNPESAWDEYLKEQAKTVETLNKLKVSKLYYSNSLGTKLEVGLLDGCLWQSACSNKWLVNMPSYEIFTTPNYHTTEGIVYSSRPLIYNGKSIEDFCLEFKNGKVVKWKAKEGADTLEEIIKSDKYSAYLGEVALVNYDSPISKTEITFMTTLIDENASCHIALGSGFLECILNGFEFSEKELDEKGINLSKNHVDFMIGTKDLKIEADTIDGHITIMENGNLII